MAFLPPPALTMVDHESIACSHLSYVRVPQVSPSGQIKASVLLSTIGGDLAFPSTHQHPGFARSASPATRFRKYLAGNVVDGKNGRSTPTSHRRRPIGLVRLGSQWCWNGRPFSDPTCGLDQTLHDQACCPPFVCNTGILQLTRGYLSSLCEPSGLEPA